MLAQKCRICGERHPLGPCSRGREPQAAVRRVASDVSLVPEAVVEAPKQKPVACPPHHRAWLESHPGRTREWLAARVSEGFEVRHVDEDHGNNDPDNLLLIEQADHAKLHRLVRQSNTERPKFDRTAYQRELMRKRRAKEKGVV